MKEYIEANVTVERPTEEGAIKKVTERYIVDELTFSKAEMRLLEEVAHSTTGEVNVKDMKRVQYMEIIETTDADADKFIKVRISLLHYDEETGKERRSAATILVQGSNIPNALDRLRESMRTSMQEFDIVNVADTKIMDIFHYQASAL